MRRNIVTRRGGKAALSILASLTAGLLFAPTASAGQLTLNISTAGAGCGLLTPFSQSQWLYATPCGSGPLSVGFQARSLTDVTGIIGGPMVRHGQLSVPAGTRVGYRITAPAGIAINSAVSGFGSVNSINTGDGWGGTTYWDGGHDQVHSDAPFRAIIDAAGANGRQFSSSYWGFTMVCGWSQCSNSARMSLNSVILTATDNQAPSLSASGMWDQRGYIWNPPGDPWPLTVSASDVTGVCSMSATINNSPPVSSPKVVQDTSQWQQCPDQTWSPSVDTTEYVTDRSGPLAITLNAQNAAQVPTQASTSLNVDNTPLNVSLSTPNDPNPTVWVNHRVAIDAIATAGASGVAGKTCSVDAATAQPYPATGVTVDGDGVHTVSCTAWNGAVDPQGNPASATGSTTVHIDEAAPSLAWQAQNPNDPTGLAVDASDSESGVAAGSIEMAPAGSSSWSSVPTTFDGSRLLAHFDDARLRGAYTFRATSCDNVGNCDSTTQELSLPVRLASSSEVSFQTLGSPQCTSTTVPTHDPTGRAGRPTGGVGLAKPRAKPRSQTHAVRTRHSVVRRVCKAPSNAGRRTERVGYGHRVTVHGVLLSSAGLPLAGQSVNILTAPENGSKAFSPATIVNTNADGAWTATLPAGPSRIIEASFAGTATILPSTGEARVSVPARIAMSITPHRLPWSKVITIRGHLDGGYVPPDGVALRLLVRYPGTRIGSPILALRTDASGAFTIKWSYHAGRGVASYPFWISTTATESDYPFAAANSRHIAITFGVKTPRPPRPKRAKAASHRHRRTHARHRASHKHRRARTAGKASARRHRHPWHRDRSTPTARPPDAGGRTSATDESSESPTPRRSRAASFAPQTPTSTHRSQSYDAPASASSPAAGQDQRRRGQQTMIARIRGEHDRHPGRWRPTADPQYDPLERGRDKPRETQRPGPVRSLGQPSHRGLRRSQGARWLALLALVAIGLITAAWSLSHRAPARRELRLPATPRAWLDAYEAAAIDNPPLVCSRLFSPALASAYAAAAHGSCTGYFERMTSSSVAVRRILQEGETAVLELRQTVDRTDWAVVLSHQSAGWQAIDLLDGRLLR